MTKTKFITSLVLAVSVLIGQVGTVLAASPVQKAATISGTVQSITLETDPNTGITTVIIDVISKGQVPQTVRIGQRTAEGLGLITFNEDGSPVINNSALGKPVKIETAMVIPEQPQDRHPVGDALATFFFESLGIENDDIYHTIMAAHEKGVGFGVIAQALWMTQQIPQGSLPEIGDNLAIFKALLAAKESGNYGPFTFVDENGVTVTPKNWGQLRKALLEHKKIGKSANVTSNQNEGNSKDKKDKKDKTNKGDNAPGHEKDKQNDK